MSDMTFFTLIGCGIIIALKLIAFFIKRDMEREPRYANSLISVIRVASWLLTLFFNLTKNLNFNLNLRFPRGIIALNKQKKPKFSHICKNLANLLNLLKISL